MLKSPARSSQRRGLMHLGRAHRVMLTVVLVAVGASGTLVQTIGPQRLVAAMRPTEPTPQNYVVNGTFDGGLSGWEGGRNTALASASGRNSTPGVLVSDTANTPSIVTLNDSTNSVSEVTVGERYRATAWVRSLQAPQTVTLRLIEEEPDFTALGNAQSNVTLTDLDWQRITVDYTAAHSGATLDVNVLGTVAPQAGFVIDDLSLEPVGSADSTTADGSAGGAQGSDTASDGADCPAGTGGWKLKWCDGFNGSALDTDNWTALDRSTYGDGNGELACLESSNVAVGGGTLKITAKAPSKRVICGSHDGRFPRGRQYTSGMISSQGKVAFKYGKFEIRAKMPTTQGTSNGLWPAFWLRPNSGSLGELDILELTGTGKKDKLDANHVSQTIHYDYAPTYPQQEKDYYLPSGTFDDGYHTFTVDWEPGSITWYVDGVQTYTRTRATTHWLDTAFDRAFYMRINMAVGGGGRWNGPPDSDTAFPAQYTVDWVRVYQR